MKKKKRICKNGKCFNKNLDLRDLMLLNYQKLTNKTKCTGEFDVPELYCNSKIYPDYIALYSEKANYFKTELTAVGFFEYDKKFDGQHGLFNAIYYNNVKDLNKFIERFKGIKFAITPDYSLLEDSDENENIHRLKKMRIVGLWFIHVIGAIVIPLISFPSFEKIDTYLAGLDNCTVVAISTKGHMNEPIEFQILCKTVEYLIENKKNLEAIIVYDVCGDSQKISKIFKIAEEKGIKVIVPNNSLKSQNMIRWEKKHEAF